MQQLIRKISPRTVFGSKGDILTLVMSDKDAEHPLFVVAGKCNGKREGESDNGPWTALLGRFMAQACDEKGAPKGVIYTAGVCHLPNYVVDSILGQLEEPGDTVEFKFAIGATYDEASATSYVYTATPLIEAKPEDDDVLKLLTAEKPAQIAGPKRGKKAE